MKGILYLVATPIGNIDDITLRAIQILREVDLVVVEERKEGFKLLRHLGIDAQIESINEHNEEEASSYVLDHLLKGQSVALVSDAGTPLFADPGTVLVQMALAKGIRVAPIPGASSILPALTSSGFPIKKFVFEGFLSPKRENRIKELRSFRAEKRAIVLMDTPYRLLQLLKDIVDVFGESRMLSVAFDLTLPTEEIRRGSPKELYQHFSKGKKKGEFVIIIGPSD